MDQEDIQLLLQRINESWLIGYPEQMPAVLGECFDDRMVIRGGPALQVVANGKEACIQSYLDFVRQASIAECTLSTPEVDVTGDTAVATCAWKMTYYLDKKEYKETGHDIFVFARTEGRWLAVWRTLLPDATPVSA